VGVQQTDTESVARQTPQTRHFFFLHSSAEKIINSRVFTANFCSGRFFSILYLTHLTQRDVERIFSLTDWENNKICETAMFQRLNNLKFRTIQYFEAGFFIVELCKIVFLIFLFSPKFTKPL
jgi:hypothetical protein